MRWDRAGREGERKERRDEERDGQVKWKGREGGSEGIDKVKEA